MKILKHILLALLIYIVTISCGGSSSETTNSTSNTLQNSTKKGVSLSYKISRWPEFVSKLSPHWHYHWGSTRSIFQPSGVEFVPMIWGSISSGSQTISDLSKRYDIGEFSFLLGFNEPDNENQSNMPVDDVIDQWPLLESIGVPLISPSPVNVQNNWMDTFMGRAKNIGLRVDYLGFHWYGGANPDAFLNRVDQAYEKYGIPIWITEFAVADWDAETASDNKWSETEVLTFMQKVLPELEKRSYVYRYAWLNGESPQLISSKLIERSGVLTELGEYYATYSRNESITLPDELPVIDDMANNLLKNGNFESPISDEWEAINARLATLNHTQIAEGYLAFRLQSGYSELMQSIHLTEHTNNYTLELLTKCNEQSSNTASLILQGDLNSNYLFPLHCTTDWNQQSFEFSANDMEHVSLTISKENSEILYVDNIKIIDSDN